MVPYWFVTVLLAQVLVWSGAARFADAEPGMGQKTIAAAINTTQRGLQGTVKQYGAKGDGLTDDTAAIQKAVDDVYHKGGGTLLFPAGIYVVRSINFRENIIYQGSAVR